MRTNFEWDTLSLLSKIILGVFIMGTIFYILPIIILVIPLVIVLNIVETIVEAFNDN